MPFLNHSIAAFDFDGTLTRRDTLLAFLKTGSTLHSTAFKCLQASPALVGFVLGMTPRQQAKEALLKSFVEGEACELWEERAAFFTTHTLPVLLNQKGMDRFYWHRDRGDACLIVSATLGLYLRPWAEREGFASVIASEVEVTQEGRLTGRLATPNCWGAEKVLRLNEVLGPRESYYLYAYGDSRGDKELIEFADEGYHNWKLVKNFHPRHE